jgi:mRNA interferase YafQ
MQVRKVHTTNKFDKDVALAIRRGKNTNKLRGVIDLLATRQPLPRELQDHPLKCGFKGLKGCRDLHIEPDWVLIYVADEEDLRLIRTGTHADLFGM